MQVGIVILYLKKIAKAYANEGLGNRKSECRRNGDLGGKTKSCSTIEVSNLIANPNHSMISASNMLCHAHSTVL